MNPVVNLGVIPRHDECVNLRSVISLNSRQGVYFRQLTGQSFKS
jgi:uncharacterized protein YqjF (DUF2071 family)